jgi:RNA polymerase sigma-70 factor (ECF subfamily)
MMSGADDGSEDGGGSEGDGAAAVWQGQDELAAKAADAAVRRELVEGHRDFLSFLMRRLGDRDAAEEVLQAFMARALARAPDLKEVLSVRGWLGRVLATTIVDHHRRVARRARRETATDPSDLDEMPIEPDAEIERQICFCLYRILPTLKPDYAELIWRIDLLDEPRDRVAVALSLTLGNLNVRLHRGRRALKARLEAICLTCPEHGFLDCRCDEGERIRKIRAKL